MTPRGRLRFLITLGLIGLVGGLVWFWRSPYFQAVRVVEIEPGRLYRGAWQKPWPMRSLIEEHQLRGVLALAHPVAHALPARERDLIRAEGVRWKHIPIIDDPSMTNGKSMIDLLDEAADWLADPENRPLYFHCHHGINRTSMVQMAWRIKHCGYTIDQATTEIERTIGEEAVPRGDDFQRVVRFVEEKVKPMQAARIEKLARR